MFDIGFVAGRLLLGVWLLWRIGAPPGGPRRPTCSVIVPARNEAHVLPASVGALASQLGPGDELIVVDDDSLDDTGLVAATAGARVLDAPALPPGWTGKTWACSTGAAAATGEVLCFVDADTTLAPGALDRLVRTQASGGGMVSSCPYHGLRRPYERLSALFNLI
ncbi:MAG: glycosyltransferase, partial [Acidimicrobiales bacterium]